MGTPKWWTPNLRPIDVFFNSLDMSQMTLEPSTICFAGSLRQRLTRMVYRVRHFHEIEGCAWELGFVPYWVLA